MRLFNIATALVLFLVFMTGLHSCKKDSNLILSPDGLETGSYIRLDSTINTRLNFADINNSSVAIMVSGYGEAIDKIVSYVSTNNTSNKATWKKIKETPVTDNKATLLVKATEIASALGIPATNLSPGNQYTIYNEVVTKSGKTYSLANTNTDLESSAAFKTALRFNATIICPFVPAAAAGTYTITEDGWDGASGEKAVVTATSTAITITYLFPFASPDPGFKPVTVNVDPATGVATMPKQVYGGYGSGFQNFTGQGSGFVFSCTGTITLQVTHVSASGTGYGTYKITLKK